MFNPSPQGIKFTGDHEGTVTRAYRDQGGVWTIGRGFTNLSPVCKAWFIAHFGHPLQAGDTMTIAQCDELMALVMAKETVPYANALLPATQSAFDAENDVLYNCGPRAAGWQWALAAKAQDYAKAAKLLVGTAVTAQGKPSAGLVRRRKDEAALLLSGGSTQGRAVYPETTTDTSLTTDVDGTKRIQQGLTKLKYYTGPLDGNYQSPSYVGAVKNFQRAYGLRVDGRVGQATRSTLTRALDATVAPNLSIASGGGVSGMGWFSQQMGWLHLDNPWVLVAVGVAALLLAYGAFLVWHNRGIFLRKRTPA